MLSAAADVAPACVPAFRWRQRAAFLMVYIAEAHAADEWPISSARFNEGRGAVNIRQHKSNEERIAAAKGECTCKADERHCSC